MFNRYEKQLEDAVEAVDVQSVTAILSRLNMGDELPKYLVKMGLWNELWIDWPDNLGIEHNPDERSVVRFNIPALGLIIGQEEEEYERPYIWVYDMERGAPVASTLLNYEMRPFHIYEAVLWTMVEDVVHLWNE